MKLPSTASRPLLPIPLSVLLTLLWVGLVRLLFLLVQAQAGMARQGDAWMAMLFGERILGRARLPTMIVAISLLLLVYLWLDYRSQTPRTNWRAVVFLCAAALLVYLVWGVWHSWWRHLESLPAPAGVLMTAVPAGTAGAAA